MHYGPGHDDGRYLLPMFDIDPVPPQAYPSVVRGVFRLMVLVALVGGVAWMLGSTPDEWMAWVDEHMGYRATENYWERHPLD